MNASLAEMIGVLVACGAAAAGIALPDRRHRTIAIAIAVLAAPILVIADVWNEPRVADFRGEPVQLAGAVIVAAAAVAALTLAIRRRPEVLPIAAVAMLPIRIPIEIGGETANLLVPLYLVIASGVAARVLQDRARSSETRATADRWPLWLRYVLAAGLVLYAIQTAYSEDVSNAVENVGFFLAPFAVLFCLLSEIEWSPTLLRRVLVAIGVVAVACSLIAIYQYFARDLFLNPELFDANELHVYFRVNSIFFDPNIFGRYLALAIAAYAAVLAWGGPRWRLVAAAAVCALGLVALAFSYSITSFAALLAGLGALAILRWGARGFAATAAFGVAGLIALVLAGGAPTSDIEDVRSIDSGHADLISGGIDLAQDRPIWGWGSGSFGRAFYERIERARTTVSHSEPITVAAEQGVIGFGVYLALLATAIATLFGAGVRSSMARSLVAALFVVMVIDSLGYTGFTTDPATWALLALGIALRPTRVTEAPATITS
jgi:O-antigen ligase